MCSESVDQDVPSKELGTLKSLGHGDRQVWHGTVQQARAHDSKYSPCLESLGVSNLLCVGCWWLPSGPDVSGNITSPGGCRVEPGGTGGGISQRVPDRDAPRSREAGPSGQPRGEGTPVSSCCGLLDTRYRATRAATCRRHHRAGAARDTGLEQERLWELRRDVDAAGAGPGG